MDPIMYLASSELAKTDRNSVRAIEEFYQSNGRLPLWVRCARGAAAIAKSISLLLSSSSANFSGNDTPSARMVR